MRIADLQSEESVGISRIFGCHSAFDCHSANAGIQYLERTLLFEKGLAQPNRVEKCD